MFRASLGPFLIASDRLQDRLEYSSAINDYDQQIINFKTLAISPADIERQNSAAGLDFLRYCHAYMRTRELWSSWSVVGVITAASLLSVPREKIARTMSLLESRGD